MLKKGIGGTGVFWVEKDDIGWKSWVTSKYLRSFGHFCKSARKNTFFVFWTIRPKKVLFFLDFRHSAGKMDRQFYVSRVV